MNTLLGIWAHPDDEVFVAGGLLAAAARRGDRVVCLHMTRGEAGLLFRRPTDPDSLAVLRTHELAGCLDLLGVSEQHFFDYPDGALADVDRDEAVDRLHDIIAELSPDTIVTFGADGFTGHPDHQVLSGWVTDAFHQWGDPAGALYQATVGAEWKDAYAPALNEFDFFWPGYPHGAQRSDLCFELDDDLVTTKVNALRKHASQMRALFDCYGDRFMRAVAATEHYALVYPRAGAASCCFGSSRAAT